MHNPHRQFYACNVLQFCKTRDIIVSPAEAIPHINFVEFTSCNC